jgi:xanthine dehydrogenase accessory factor
MEVSEVAATVDRWLAAGQRAAVAWPVGFAGFSTRRPEEVLAVSETGQRVGNVLGGPVTATLAGNLAELLGGAPGPLRLIRLAVDEGAAAAAGLSCGGTMTVALHEAAAMPTGFWRAVTSGRPVAVVSRVGSDGSSEARSALLIGGDDRLAGGLGDPALDERALTEARALLDAGRTGSRVVAVDAGSLVIEAVVPVTRLVVVGAGTLADALQRQAALLGWRSEVAGGAGEAADAIGRLGASDGVVVLSHDREVDVPTLAVAVRARVAYIGALGSRRTQAARRESLLAAGVGEDALAAIRGPAGLDLGGRSPEEIALAICAEMLAVRSGRGGVALRERTASINTNT